MEDRIIKPSFIREDNRGSFIEILNEGPWETIIHGEMKTNSEMGDHYHKECKAFFFITKGKAKVSIKEAFKDVFIEYELNSGEGIFFMPYEMHKVHYLSNSSFLLLKSYRFDPNNPDIYEE